MFDRISNGFSLAHCSWQVLMRDKKLIVFPILSGIACLLVLLSFAAPFFFHQEWLKPIFNDQDGVKMPWWGYIVLFAFYFCNYFVVVFFNSALISCALVRFNGGEATLGDGLRVAMARLPQIVAWALVSATVGVLLKVIENASNRVGEIVSALLGTAWSVLTYFVVPVLVVEKVGPIDAIRRSMEILKKTWGEALVGNMGMDLFVFLLFLPVIIVGVIGFALLGVMPPAGIALLVLAAVGVGLVAAIGPALHGIFLAAIYQYAAQGVVPDGFDKGMLRSAFTRKR
ncbi:MAG TPA: DUF6159 family protein [Gemmataceae bacterium]|jgi:hypothetical protein|nr:DUF6159 family protein [Gemmataceae bacterium]